MPQVTVIVPTLRALAWLPRCIEALRAQTWHDFEVIVIDNASTDGTSAWLAQQADLRAIRNDINTGFAAACNQAIHASDAPMLALLNDDAFPEPDWLAALVARMRTPDMYKIGSCASLMLFADAPDIVQSAGICMDRAGIAWDRFAGGPVTSARTLAPANIFGASGGAALYRRTMLNEIGLFDERFFMYLEDVDLAWRAQRAGWQCAYVPAARVLHQTSATSIEGSPFKNRLLGRNKLWMCAKNAPLSTWPVIAYYDLLAVFWAGLARNEWSHAHGRIEASKRLREFRRSNKAGTAAVPYSPLAWPWRVPARMTNSSDT